MKGDNWLGLCYRLWTSSVVDWHPLQDQALPGTFNIGILCR